MKPDYYTQHRWRIDKPEHRVKIFFRPAFWKVPSPSVFIGTLQLDLATGEVTCDPEEDAVFTKPEFHMLGKVLGWISEGIPRTEGP